ncbi:uncharacterized protein LOC144383491 isoform X4 [Gasterosteus aculeatus]
MTGVARLLAFICMAGHHLSSALVAPAGGNVSLTCNLTSRSGITWFLLRSDRPLPLLTVRPSRLGDVTVNLHGAGGGRLGSRGHPEGGPVHLDIRGLVEEDAGLYFCTGRCEESVCVGGGLHLVVGEAINRRALTPWFCASRSRGGGAAAMLESGDLRSSRCARLRPRRHRWPLPALRKSLCTIPV